MLLITDNILHRSNNHSCLVTPEPKASKIARIAFDTLQELGIMDGWVDGQMAGVWMSSQLHGNTCRWMDLQMGEWMDEWMEE